MSSEEKERKERNSFPSQKSCSAGYKSSNILSHRLNRGRAGLLLVSVSLSPRHPLDRVSSHTQGLQEERLIYYPFPSSTREVRERAGDNEDNEDGETPEGSQETGR